MDEPIAVCLDFSVLYEDEDVLVVDKAAPLLTHPAGPKDEPTLWHGLRELLSYELATGGQVSLVNRLDRETSGISLVAKTAYAASQLGKAMQERRLHKKYLAVVQGCPAWTSARCEEPIARMTDVGESEVLVRQCTHPLGRPCRTDFVRLESPASVPERALLSCIAHTGRLHQIRVHLEHLCHPLVGDKIYGGDPTCYLRFMEEGWTPALEAQLHIPRHALHAAELSFPHVKSGELITVNSPLPESLAALLCL